MKKKRENKLTDQLRRLIAESGVSRYEIARKTGIDESALGKFYNGQRGISSMTLDKLGEYLGLEITQKRKK